MERRDFLKKGCLLCMGGVVLSSILESCESIPIYKTNSQNKRLLIPIEKFNKNNFLIVRPSDVRYDIAVIKYQQSEYRSFIMLCTHADNPVNFNGKEFSCSLHGSLFNKDGKVEKGPAEKSLISLETIKEDNFIKIKLA